MDKTTFRLSAAALMLAISASVSPGKTLAANAARVDFAVGNVNAVNATGQSRALAKGAQINEGDTIRTNSGRAHLRFTDGAYVSLQPQSEFRIDQYRYDGREDGSEKGLFALLKGGLRTITGFIGRSNKQNYQVSTAVATIGIRGTEYTIQYGSSITGTVGEGEIEVCNGAGCLNVTSGESYYVQEQNVKPVLTGKGPDLPPTPPQNPPPQFAIGENVDPAGLPDPGFVLSGVRNLDFVEGSFCSGCVGAGTGAMVFDSEGKLQIFNGQAVSAVQMGGNDGLIAWGIFGDSSRSGLLSHFVSGIPVPSSDLNDLSRLGAIGTYASIGKTPVTDASNQIIGQLNAATLTVDFGGKLPSIAAMDWTINNAAVSATLTGTLSGSKLAMSGLCGTNCSASADVSLFGPNAVRAGMVYKLSDVSMNPIAVGAAAFARH